MKYLLTVICLLSFNAFANGGGGSSGGVPNLPCYVDGEYQGTIEVTTCNKMKGTQSK